MPERSYAKVARALRKSTTLLRRWSHEDGWPERCAAWDAELDLRRREEFAAATVDASRGQAETAARIRLGVDAFARSFLDELARYRERGEDPFADLTPSQKLTKLGAASRALQHAQQVERLARGLSTENVGGRAGEALIPPEIERKSMDELQVYLLGRREAGPVRQRELTVEPDRGATRRAQDGQAQHEPAPVSRAFAQR
jgi:hypothetical protein